MNSPLSMESLQVYVHYTEYSIFDEFSNLFLSFSLFLWDYGIKAVKHVLVISETEKSKYYELNLSLNFSLFVCYSVTRCPQALSIYLYCYCQIICSCYQGNLIISTFDTVVYMSEFVYCALCICRRHTWLCLTWSGDMKHYRLFGAFIRKMRN